MLSYQRQIEQERREFIGEHLAFEVLSWFSEAASIQQVLTVVPSNQSRIGSSMASMAAIARSEVAVL
jgi:hypothetical protein